MSHQHQNQLLNEIEQAITSSSLALIALDSEASFLTASLEHEQTVLHPVLQFSSETLTMFQRESRMLIDKMKATYSKHEHSESSSSSCSCDVGNDVVEINHQQHLPSIDSFMKNTFESFFTIIMSKLHETNKRIRRSCTIPLTLMKNENRKFLDLQEKLIMKMTNKKKTNDHHHQQQMKEDPEIIISSSPHRNNLDCNYNDLIEQQALSSYKMAIEESLAIECEDEGAAFMMLLNQFIDKNKK